MLKRFFQRAIYWHDAWKFPRLRCAVNCRACSCRRRWLTARPPDLSVSRKSTNASSISLLSTGRPLLIALLNLDFPWHCCKSTWYCIFHSHTRFLSTSKWRAILLTLVPFFRCHSTTSTFFWMAYEDLIQSTDQSRYVYTVR